MNFIKDWRDTANSVLDKLKYTLTNESTQQDVLITSGSGSTETTVKAHSFMLFIGSQVFEKLFQEAKVNNEGMKEIKLPDVRPGAVEFLMKNIYTDFVDLGNEDAIDILHSALKFNLRDVAERCVSKLKEEMTTENVSRIFEEATKMDVQELVQCSQDFILKHAGEVFQKEEFLDITNESLCKLLMSNELDTDEVSVFNAVMNWGKAECKRLDLEEDTENLRFVLKKILPLIRFPQMTSMEFATVVVPTNILDEKEVIELYNYLTIKNSDPAVQVEHPPWICFSCERKFSRACSAVSVTNGIVPACDQSGTECDMQKKKKSMIDKKEQMLQYLKEISGRRTISGLFVVYSTDRNKGIKTIQNIAGVEPGILARSMPSFSAGVDKWQLFTEEIILDWNSGYFVHVIWGDNQHPLAQLEMFKTSDEAKWKDLTHQEGHLHKVWIKQLDAIAPYLQQLQNAGVVVICDLLPCINYKAFLWGGRPGKNGSLKLYQITRDYLTNQHGLESILWTWSLFIKSSMTQLEEFWPGNNYVDIASVYMWDKKQLEMNLYQKLLKVVGDKPISMEYIYTVPPPELLGRQPRWTWFTAYDDYLQNPTHNNENSIKISYQSLSITNKENNAFMKSDSK